MDILCKHCGSCNHIKRGFVQGKQRFSCKSCNRTFRIGDLQEKYSFEKKIKILKLYLDGSGIRFISRVEDTRRPLYYPLDTQYLTRFNRKTKRFSKKTDMIE